MIHFLQCIYIEGVETKDTCTIMYCNSKVTHAQFMQVVNQSKIIGAHLVSAAALRQLKQFRQEAR